MLEQASGRQAVDADLAVEAAGHERVELVVLPRRDKCLLRHVAVNEARRPLLRCARIADREHDSGDERAEDET